MRSKLSLLLALVFIIAGSHLYAQSPLQVRVSGQGTQAIIFIPGFSCSGDVWKETLPSFQKNYKCYTLTMPGVAGVPPLSMVTPATISNWEAIIVRYIQQNKIDKPIVIGHSMGGVLALMLAADHPGLVSKVVVVDAVPCYSALQDPSFVAKENNDCSMLVSMMKGMTDEQFFQMQLKTLPSLMADTAHLRQAAQWAVSSDRATLGSIYCDFLNTDARGRMTSIHCPALILLESTFTSAMPAIAGQYKDLKGVQIHVATKGLHFIMYDDPQWYNNELAAFIK
ncbi:MAG: alpha/beta hydrolase [Taibaiella sp.]|nr:alpha/beta hydrolase [Taibaiella sp.]